MAVPTARVALLLAAGLVLPLGLGAGPSGLLALLAWDLAVAGLALLDARRAPGPSAWAARRLVQVPLSGFVRNPVDLELASSHPRPQRVDLADAPPVAFASVGHRVTVAVPAGGAVHLRYQVVPGALGRHAFGDLHLRVLGPWGLAWRPLRLPLARTVSVYPDVRPLVRTAVAAPAQAGRTRHRGWHEGREFAALRPYGEGDDLRAIDWKATARHGSPVVREWQPERNQTVWLLLDCGRHLSAQLADGRTKLDRAVEAALALAWTAGARGDRAGAILFGAEVERVVPPQGGRGWLGAMAEALHLATARPVESDYGAALDALADRQRRRALVLIFTDLTDPDTCALLQARAALLRRRHLVLVCAISDSEVVDAARVRPADEEAAFLRATAGRLLDERELAVARLAAGGVPVVSVPAASLTAAVVDRYLEAKARGAL